MDKDFIINGCVITSANVSEEDFYNKFIKFIESNGWLFCGFTDEVKMDSDDLLDDIKNVKRISSDRVKNNTNGLKSFYSK